MNVSPRNTFRQQTFAHNPYGPALAMNIASAAAETMKGQGHISLEVRGLSFGSSYGVPTRHFYGTKVYLCLKLIVLVVEVEDFY